MISWEILIMSALLTSSIYSALLAKKYKTECRIMALCFKKAVGRYATTEELREAAEEELNRIKADWRE